MGKIPNAPGFRFHPTDQELVAYYLKRKICGRKMEYEIAELDLYKFEPWDLREFSPLLSKDPECYFFSPRDKKYANGSRTNRSTEAGYWKATGKDKSISSGCRNVGMKKTLVYYKGRAPQGEKTDWVMHEYRLDDGECERLQASQNGFVLCRIFYKSRLDSASVEDEEWETLPAVEGDGCDGEAGYLQSVHNAPVNQFAATDVDAGERSSYIDTSVKPLQDTGTESASFTGSMLPKMQEKGSLVPVVGHMVAGSSGVPTHDGCDSEDGSYLLASSLPSLYQGEDILKQIKQLYECQCHLGSDVEFSQADLYPAGGFLELLDLETPISEAEDPAGIKTRSQRKEFSNFAGQHIPDVPRKSRSQRNFESNRPQKLSVSKVQEAHGSLAGEFSRSAHCQDLQLECVGCGCEELVHLDSKQQVSEVMEGSVLKVSTEIGLLQAMQMQSSVITCTVDSQFRVVIENIPEDSLPFSDLKLGLVPSSECPTGGVELGCDENEQYFDALPYFSEGCDANESLKNLDVDCFLSISEGIGNMTASSQGFCIEEQLTFAQLLSFIGYMKCSHTRFFMVIFWLLLAGSAWKLLWYLRV